MSAISANHPVVPNQNLEEKRKTYPLSPVASTRFLNRGCSHTSRFASAVSVHQHIVRLKSSLLVNLGKNLAIAFLMVISDAAGYVSLGCWAWERGTETGFAAEAPKGLCCLKRVKPGNSSQIFMTPFLLISLYLEDKNGRGYSFGSKKKP